ncbi:MAG TPA: H-NS histone family protein [Magnetospirillum sp.]|nr:H-NS histone family protein [Magnetospirillum sp.]
MSENLSDLLKQAEELNERIRLAKIAEHDKCRADAIALIEGRGFTVAEIFGDIADASKRGRKPKDAGEDARTQVAPKYRNPDNPAETWTGRGRQPKWVAAKIAAGIYLESLKIA